MSEQSSPPKRMRYNLRSTAARQKNTNPLPIEQQPGCSSDAKENVPQTGSEIAEKAEKNLMTLNDHCLLAIFDFLNLMEQCVVAHVNKRLNALVKFYIQTKYHVRFENDFDLIPHKGRINVEVAKAFFQIFGNEITKLKLTRDSFDEKFNDFHSMYEIFDSMQKHCNDIKKFTLQGFGTGGLQIFKHLEELTLEKCSVSRDWCKMNELKTLRMDKVIFRRWPLQYSHRDYGDPPIPPIPIPVTSFGNLIEVRLSDVNLGNDILGKFLTNNRKIKILSIVKCLETSPHFFGSLVQLKKLKEFEFKKRMGNALHYSYNDLHKLKNLKVLKLSFYDAPAQAFFEGFIKNGIVIEHFEFRGGRFNDETVSGIVQLQTLKVLKLYEVANLNESHILRIVDELKQLEELHIEMKSAHITPDALKEIVNAANRLTCLKILAPGRFNLDADTFQAILTTLQQRDQKNALELTVYGDGKQSLSVPDELLKEENVKWLKVTVLDRNTNRLYEDLTSKVRFNPPQPSYSESDSESDY